MTLPNKPTCDLAARLVSPKSWALATAAALVATTPVLQSLHVISAAHASETGESGEAGEAGEAGGSHGDGVTGFLTELGEFEAAQRIIGALYALGETDQAREHLETSHHASYEEIEHELEEYGIADFEPLAEAFAEAVRAGAPAETVQANLDALLTALSEARAQTEATDYERVMALEGLMDGAAADYAGGVLDGVVDLPIEYRDAWGFVETVRASAQAMAAGDDATLAQAGADILTRLEAVAPLFPGVTATRTEGAPNVIAATASWIEIIALRTR